MRQAVNRNISALQTMQPDNTQLIGQAGPFPFARPAGRLSL